MSDTEVAVLTAVCVMAAAYCLIYLYLTRSTDPLDKLSAQEQMKQLEQELNNSYKEY